MSRYLYQHLNTAGKHTEMQSFQVCANSRKSEAPKRSHSPAGGWLQHRSSTIAKSMLADRTWAQGKVQSTHQIILQKMFSVFKGSSFSRTDVYGIVHFQFGFCSKYGVKHHNWQLRPTECTGGEMSVLPMALSAFRCRVKFKTKVWLLTFSAFVQHYTGHECVLNSSNI